GLDFERNDLLGESPLMNCSNRSLMALCCPCVLILARDFPLARDVLCSDTHVDIFKRIGDRGDKSIHSFGVVQARAPTHGGKPIGRAAHGFDPAANRSVASAS